MNLLQSLHDSEPYLLLDGAMGTMLMGIGLKQGAPPEEWNLVQAERVQAVHEGYIAAGSRLILTNSFGGSRFRLKLHDLQEQVTELNEAAARNARAAADTAAHRGLVGGSMGPTGELLEPLGEMTFDQAQAAFAEQAAGLAAGGVDLLWIETMSDLEEVRAAVSGARQACDLPIAATMTFDTNGHTMMGVSPGQAMAVLREWDLVAIGANCGNGPGEIEDVIQAMVDSNPDVPLIAKANAGIPTLVGDELFYDGTPQVMAGYAYRVYQRGAQLIGGCCGNTPEHIRAMAAALQGDVAPAELPPRPSTKNGKQPTVAAKPGRRRRRHRRRS